MDRTEGNEGNEGSFDRIKGMWSPLPARDLPDEMLENPGLALFE